MDKRMAKRQAEIYLYKIIERTYMQIQAKLPSKSEIK